MTSHAAELEQLLSQAIEFHVHSGPDGKTPRKADVFEVLRDARHAGMRAVVLKNKSCGTGAIAQLANKYADGALAIGSITLDVSVGGFNPEAVEIEAAMGSKVVWMPTYSALNAPKKSDMDSLRYRLTVMDEKGNLLPDVMNVLEIIKKYDMVLATGHLSREETFKLIETAISLGHKKVVLTHPLTRNVNTRMEIADQLTLSNMGAFIEHTWVATMPEHDQIPPSDFTRAIRAVGLDKCVIGSDFGQVHNPQPIEGFRMMLSTLLDEGFSVAELEQMIKKNPAYLLGL